MRSFAVVAAAAAASAEASWRSPAVGGDPSSGWLTYAQYKAPAGSVITNVSMSWNVPSGPATSYGSGAPGWWYGVQTAAGDGALVQPIVACDYEGSSCQDGTYVLWGGVFDWTKPSEGMHNSDLVPSKGGDEVFSYTTCNTKSCTMFVRNERTKKTASLTYKLPTSKGTESVLYIVLEHAPQTCSAYPSGGDCTFRHITVEVDGKAVTPDFTAVKGGSAACGSKTTIKDPQTVSITWDAGESYDLNDPVALKKVAEDVNEKKAGWTADTEQTRFATLAHAQSLLGTYTQGHPLYKDEGLPKYTPLTTKSIPAEFDARTQWSNCSVIGKVRNQAGCGSCWAFGATESFEGRRCIATGKNFEYSAGQTSSCSGLFGNGCGGGQPSSAANWFVHTGVETGGEYGEDNGCVPYECPPCPKGLYPPDCETNECGNKLKCEKSCTNSNYKIPFAQDKAKAAKSFGVSGVAGAQQALMETGPIAATFTVYADFPTYKSGVYKHTSGSALGGHAVVLIGWGTENGQDYWLLKNSWTAKWGDEGFFKIVRGSNDCGIESEFSGVTF
eukprot:Hpha_TRINITY_DN16518_c3_g1::TRINITY_DN16518_c3_g1_i4::g.134213::m.134213/K01363/CTSB; cathepsin B